MSNLLISVLMTTRKKRGSCLVFFLLYDAHGFDLSSDDEDRQAFICLFIYNNFCSDLGSVLKMNRSRLPKERAKGKQLLLLLHHHPTSQGMLSFVNHTLLGAESLLVVKEE